MKQYVFNKTEATSTMHAEFSSPEVKPEDRPKDEIRFRKFLNTIFCLCELAGYHLEERIIVKDLRTGKIWR